MTIILFETSNAGACNMIQSCIETINFDVDIFKIIPQLTAQRKITYAPLGPSFSKIILTVYTTYYRRYCIRCTPV